MPLSREDAWRCKSCGELMYNTESGYPAPGAPMPHFWSLEYNEVCSVCYDMILPLCTQEYWKNLHEADRQAMLTRKENNDRLTGRRDYFTGA